MSNGLKKGEFDYLTVALASLWTHTGEEQIVKASRATTCADGRITEKADLNNVEGMFISITIGGWVPTIDKVGSSRSAIDEVAEIKGSHTIIIQAHTDCLANKGLIEYLISDRNEEHLAKILKSVRSNGASDGENKYDNIVKFVKDFATPELEDAIKNSKFKYDKDKLLNLVEKYVVEQSMLNLLDYKLDGKKIVEYVGESQFVIGALRDNVKRDLKQIDEQKLNQQLTALLDEKYSAESLIQIFTEGSKMINTEMVKDTLYIFNPFKNEYKTFEETREALGNPDRETVKKAYEELVLKPKKVAGFESCFSVDAIEMASEMQPDAQSVTKGEFLKEQLKLSISQTLKEIRQGITCQRQ